MTAFKDAVDTSAQERKADVEEVATKSKVRTVLALNISTSSGNIVRKGTYQICKSRLSGSGIGSKREQKVGTRIHVSHPLNLGYMYALKVKQSI